VAFSPKVAVLAVGDGDGSTYLWNVLTGQRIAALRDPASGGITSVAFSPNGQLLAAGGQNGVTYLWNMSWLSS
jgi:WD40 repeat protein